jgi:hypothetical protein
MNSQMSRASATYCRFLYGSGSSKHNASLIKVKLVSSYQHCSALRLCLTNLM